MPNLDIYIDGPSEDEMKDLLDQNISGFTTNPTLMKRAGIKDYKKFALNVLKYVKIKPISFLGCIFASTEFKVATIFTFLIIYAYELHHNN